MRCVLHQIACAVVGSSRSYDPANVETRFASGCASQGLKQIRGSPAGDRVHQQHDRQPTAAADTTSLTEVRLSAAPMDADVTRLLLRLGVAIVAIALAVLGILGIVALVV